MKRIDYDGFEIVSGARPGFYRNIVDKAMELLGGNGCAIYIRDLKDPRKFIRAESIPIIEHESSRIVDIEERKQVLSQYGSNCIGITFDCINNARKTHW